MFLKKLDFISPQITLYYFNQERHINPISGCLTLTVYFAILACSIFFIIQFFSKSEPIAFYYNHFQEDVGIYYFNTSGIFHYVTLGNKPIDFASVNIIGIPKYIPLYVKNNNLSSVDKYYIYGSCNDNDIKGLDIIDYNKTELLTSACIRKMYDKKKNKYFNTDDKEFVYPDLRHGASNPNYNLYAVIVELCRNESAFNENQCKSVEDRQNYVSSFTTVSLSIVDHIVKVDQYSKPIESFYYKISSGLIANTFNSNQINFNPLIVKTDKGILFPYYQELKTYMFGQNVISRIDSGNTGILVAYNFWIQNNVEKYSRSYKKIQDTCANIGGVSKVVLIICDVLNYVFRELTLVIDAMKLYSMFASKKSSNINNNNNHSDNNNWFVNVSSFHNLSNCSDCSQGDLKVNHSNEELKQRQTQITTRIRSCVSKKQIKAIEVIKEMKGECENEKKRIKGKEYELHGEDIQFNCRNIWDYVKLILVKSYKKTRKGKVLVWYKKQRRMIISEEFLFKSYFMNKCVFNHIQSNNYSRNNMRQEFNNSNCKHRKLTLNSNIKKNWLSEIPLFVHNKHVIDSGINSNNNNQK